MFGVSEISNFMHHHYGNYDDIQQRLIGSYFTGLGLGVGHLKGFGDFKSKAALKRTQIKALKLRINKVKEIVLPGNKLTSDGKGIESNKLTEEQINNFSRQ